MILVTAKYVTTRNIVTLSMQIIWLAGQIRFQSTHVQRLPLAPQAVDNRILILSLPGYALIRQYCNVGDTS